eukprot:GHRQ01008465.1.p1 GENE.GHRQ01008465.1~~GHRQ01008465.1.p1  ORF type:complete len:484 (+),score=208.82 GHRQ01008465.1:280-1731(+)
MPRELITVQVGQCGNQIGCRFWELALREHAAHNASGVYDDALSSFFRNIDQRQQPPLNLPVGNGMGAIQSLKARAVVVDMEEGVIQHMLKGPLSELFDSQQLLYDVSGAGNNWAHGHHGYGPQYRDALLGRLRTAAEAADSLQGFLLLHSLGGGTGSGLGTYLLGLLEEEFPEVFRFSAPVFPSEDDHVVTSPYDAALAAACLVESASCVLPVENQALAAISSRLEVATAKGTAAAGSGLGGPGAAKSSGSGKPAGGNAAAWDAMNGIAANMLLHLTSSVRFEGTLNTDLNDITMNLVPFPRMHFLLSSLAPLASPKDMAQLAQPRSVDQLFSDVFSREGQLLACDPRSHTCLATALMMRGRLSLNDAQRNIARLRPSLKMAHWNTEGFKLGLCSQPPVGLPYSLLCLSNNCCIADTFSTLMARFDKLYKRKIFVHHYTEFMEATGFDAAAECLNGLIAEYRRADSAGPAPVTRMRPRGLTFL